MKITGQNIGLVVKRRGHKEPFDERKVYGSVYAACASAHYKETECERIADAVTKKVMQALKGKKVVNSLDIRKLIESDLKKRDKELHFYYEHHLPNLKRL